MRESGRDVVDRSSTRTRVPTGRLLLRCSQRGPGEPTLGVQPASRDVAWRATSLLRSSRQNGNAKDMLPQPNTARSAGVLGCRCPSSFTTSRDFPSAQSTSPVVSAVACCSSWRPKGLSLHVVLARVRLLRTKVVFSGKAMLTFAVRNLEQSQSPMGE